MKEVITNKHSGQPVEVKGLSGNIIFECTGPGKDDCSVLVCFEPGTPSARKFVKLSDVKLRPAEKE